MSKTLDQIRKEIAALVSEFAELQYEKKSFRH